MIPIPHPAIAIASTRRGTTACAIVEEPTEEEDEVIRRVWCWGQGFRGALGDGTTEDRAEPARVAGLSNVVRLVGASGDDIVFCAVTGTGDLWCWGEPGMLPGFGFGRDYLLEPTQIEVPGNVVDMSFPGLFGGGICVLLSTGDVHCYDVDPWDRLRTEPDSWVRLPDVDAADALGRSCVLEGGRALCWGGIDENWEPTASGLGGYFPLTGLVDITIDVDGNTYALTSDGRLWVWNLPVPFVPTSEPPVEVQLPCDLTGGAPLTLSRLSRGCRGFSDPGRRTGRNRDYRELRR